MEIGSVDDFLSAFPKPDEDLAKSSVRIILAMTQVQDALTTRDRGRIEEPTGTAMVVDVHGPDWVEPVHRP
ncbi:hypothetical protein IPV08_10690 [Methylobacterium sp. SD274]|uniref:hypothetical protein n=1 Tax=Methylobacterium sp. SD274 TaxID=2782009 RepID=UPI001A973C4B|nr:hypothetical protein [Methylobacterium sp. SD274]MBO1020435.1 hypothetical protein [Methylobacterium sp. SD274]